MKSQTSCVVYPTTDSLKTFLQMTIHICRRPDDEGRSTSNPKRPKNKLENCPELTSYYWTKDPTTASAFREGHFPSAYEEVTHHSLKAVSFEFRKLCGPKISKLKGVYMSKASLAFQS